jgi:hypothetical protein
VSAAAIVVVIGVLAVVATVGWILFHRNDPEDASSHTDGPADPSTARWGDANDRPGDAGTESQAAPRRGEPGPASDPIR